MKNFFRQFAFILLLIAGTAGLAWLGSRAPLQKDVSQNAINSLEESSIKVLKQLKGPLEVTVYAADRDAELGEIRKIISDFIGLYQRYKTDIHLTFIDPVKQPEQARAANVQLKGEMVIKYAGRSEHISQINEQVFSSALLRLAHSHDLSIMYLDGHGERKLDGLANYDLGSFFGAKLKQNGYKISGLNLAIAQEVPHNVGLLVITQPRIDILPGEIDKLLRYIDRGGNVLWLIDNEPLHGLERVAEKLELQLPAGVVIDPAAQQMNAPATWALGAAYPAQHPITRDFNLITAFPNARAITWDETSSWKHQVLVEIPERGWISRAQPGESHQFNAKRDLAGPAVIALAQQRQINDREQRIVIVGTGDFLANSFAGNGGNVDLGINMINWLSNEESLITLQPRAIKDDSIVLSQNQLMWMSILFMIVIPLCYIAWGARLWWKRRKNA